MRRVRYTAGDEDEGARLDLVVLRWLGRDLERSLSKSAVRRLLMAGVVCVNGRPAARPGMLLRRGMRLEAVVDERRLAEDLAARAGASRLAEIRVVFEDDALIAVDKPAGLPTHATADAARADLYSQIRRRVGGVDAYLGLHHRLDRDTSGVILFTKQPAANAGVARQFETHSVEKVYHALTVRPPSGAPGATRWRVEGQLAPTGHGRREKMAVVAAGGQTSETLFTLLETFASALLVEARPTTGRKHQIRAHLAHQGLAILGDSRYGGPTRFRGTEVARPMLHAHRLVLVHPLLGVRLDLRADYPVDFLEILEVCRRRPARLDTTSSTR